MEKVFKTKTGFCHILPDKIILTRGGIIGNVAKVAVGKNITRILIIYGGVSAFLLYSAFDSFQKNQVPISIFYSIVGLFLIYGIFTSLNNSATSIIERNDIKSIKFKKAIFGITRSRFEVLFIDQNRKIKKRIIMLPGSMKNGKKETENAKKIMKEEKLLNE
ncbi:phosphoribosylaminoimidazolesuccinocarboxamide synthase [Polaribacter sp. Z014]|uniref:phosphoribosylaminoimidazolesuccinocarboxamide synthase n=1 Tax=unclassified Polaribacter TaxID=196858 RepID=UPI00193B73D2|nr:MULTISPECIES: phosphoribosylaminoimidazolesuccinocarboxamide synthase [unclassified Polaribacter]MCL7764669.1 phosphoribosylaminoimidazolesuccinocarboxamide synthase [Polaribacter sp. Z014]QVY65864.1 phosphoribosylaminoimidazolesuccinocarboxamide synthase [Polaribacter sp. Q13]